eukprot:scaffold258956_cov28-Tisochrysis_lutea.AAC.1
MLRHLPHSSPQRAAGRRRPLRRERSDGLTQAYNRPSCPSERAPAQARKGTAERGRPATGRGPLGPRSAVGALQAGRRGGGGRRTRRQRWRGMPRTPSHQATQAREAERRRRTAAATPPTRRKPSLPTNRLLPLA